MNALEGLVAASLEARGMGLEDLADSLDTTPDVLTRVLAEPDRLGVEDSMALASALEVAVDDVGRAALESNPALLRQYLENEERRAREVAGDRRDDD